MAPIVPVPRVQPLFLAAPAGERFCLYHAPADPCRGAVVYLHPFGDEMNKARRMAALQARALAARGYGVLQIDLHGCGDSSGDFAEARWDTWKEDVALASDWLRARLGQSVTLWGLRLGALLALDCAGQDGAAPAGVLLWQPLASGSSFLTQFLRMKMANQLLGEGAEAAAGTKALRETLRGGTTLEVAGYELAPALADAIDALDTARLLVHGCPVHWFEIVAAAGRPPAPAAARIGQAWAQAGVDLHLHTVHGLPFWATQEITECPGLLDATATALCGVTA